MGWDVLSLYNMEVEAIIELITYITFGKERMMSSRQQKSKLRNIEICSLLFVKPIQVLKM